MSRKRPISYHLKRCSNRAKQVNMAKDWAKDWHEQTIALINRIDKTAGDDWNSFDATVAELRKLTHRKHDALQNVAKILTEPLYNDKSDKEE